jgi:sugar lactone lactonase YvrE
LIESVLAIPLAFVTHVTLNPPSAGAKADENVIQSHSFTTPFIPFANGVAVSHSGAQVAIVSTTLNRVYLYTRDPETNKLLERTHSVEVPFSADNIAYDDDDNLVLAGHPNFPELAAVAAGKDLSPSWVVSISAREAEKEADDDDDEDAQAAVSVRTKVPQCASHLVQTLFQSNGVGFTSSSTGLKDSISGVLYISGLYADPGVIVCRPQ